MNRTLTLTILLALFSTSLFAQFGYTEYQKVDGLQISTKWAKARDTDGERKPALLLATENTNDHAVAFSFDLLFYYEGILRETGRVENQCLEGLTSRTGRLNGIYFIPQNFSPEQLKRPDFMFKIENIEVKQIETCPAE